MNEHSYNLRIPPVSPPPLEIVIKHLYGSYDPSRLPPSPKNIPFPPDKWLLLHKDSTIKTSIFAQLCTQSR